MQTYYLFLSHFDFQGLRCYKDIQISWFIYKPYILFLFACS